MKKIILLSSIAACTTLFAIAQDPASKTRALSVEEANKLNGVAQPTINGIPYSQYKAQQEALKKQMPAQQQQQAVPLPQLSTVAVADVKTVNAAPSSKKLPVLATEDDAGKANKTTEVKPVKTSDNPVSIVAGGQYADKTIPGVLAPTPAVAAATAVPDATVENAAQPKLPEVMNNQAAPKAEAAIPESVKPAPVKLPEVSKQGSGN